MDTDMFESRQHPPLPRFAADSPLFFTAKSVCIGVHPWLKTDLVAAWLLQVFCVFRSGKRSSYDV
jgi:hypothetical protein